MALPLAEALAMIARGEICDAKTIIALQYLASRMANQTQTFNPSS